MRTRRSIIAGAIVVAIAAPLVSEWYLSRSAKLGPLVATPAGSHVALRIGETVRFTAAAEGAVGFTWFVWGRPVSFGPSWTFTAAPEDAGWQQVTLEVAGRKGLRAVRTWDVGVAAPTLPEIEALEPAAGSVVLADGARATFRARAHLPGARSQDRLAFEWSLDDRPIFRDEQPAEESASELVLPPPGAGSHRLRLRVTEDGRTASLADWAIDVGAAPPPPIVASVAPSAELAPPEMPPPAATPEPAPAAQPVVAPSPAAPPTPVATPPPVPPSPPRFVRAPGPRRVEVVAGNPVVLETRVEPEGAPVTYRWAVDGKPLPADGARLEYHPSTPGRRRVTLAVASGGKTLGTDAWTVAVRPDVTVAAVPSPPTLRLVRVPTPRALAGEIGRRLVFEARPEEEGARVAYRWSVDGRTLATESSARLAYEPDREGRHTIVVTADDGQGGVAREAWVVAVAAPPPLAPEPPPVAAPAVVPAPAPSALAEEDVRRWLEEYARAWSRKDVAALRRMGQVRSGADAAQLERYFRSVDGLDVDVRVLQLSVAGDRASVEFERTDTVTDPSGRRQQLRLPPIRKEIERTPDGLRFAVRGGAG